MIRLILFISFVLQLYVYVIIAMAVMSWMVAFNVVNLRNPLARNVWIGLNAPLFLAVGLSRCTVSRASNPAKVFFVPALTLSESRYDVCEAISLWGKTMDNEGEGVLSSTVDAAKASVEAAKEVGSTAASVVTEAVAGTTEKPQKAKRAKGSTKKAVSTAARPRKTAKKTAAKKPARKVAPAQGRASTKGRRTPSAKSRRGSRRGR
jgi:hypothetical protein